MLRLSFTEVTANKKPSRSFNFLMVPLQVLDHTMVEEGLVDALTAVEPHLLVVHRLLMDCQALQGLRFKLTEAAVKYFFTGHSLAAMVELLVHLVVSALQRFVITLITRILFTLL